MTLKNHYLCKYIIFIETCSAIEIHSYPPRVRAWAYGWSNVKLFARNKIRDIEKKFRY